MPAGSWLVPWMTDPRSLTYLSYPKLASGLQSSMAAVTDPSPIPAAWFLGPRAIMRNSSLISSWDPTDCLTFIVDNSFARPPQRTPRTAGQSKSASLARLLFLFSASSLPESTGTGPVVLSSETLTANALRPVIRFLHIRVLTCRRLSGHNTPLPNSYHCVLLLAALPGSQL